MRLIKNWSANVLLPRSGMRFTNRLTFPLSFRPPSSPTSFTASCLIVGLVIEHLLPTFTLSHSKSAKRNRKYNCTPSASLSAVLLLEASLLLLPYCIILLSYGAVARWNTEMFPGRIKLNCLGESGLQVFFLLVLSIF